MKHLFLINNAWLSQNNGIQQISAAKRYSYGVKMEIMWTNNHHCFVCFLLQECIFEKTK